MYQFEEGYNSFKFTYDDLPSELIYSDWGGEIILPKITEYVSDFVVLYEATGPNNYEGLSLEGPTLTYRAGYVDFSSSEWFTFLSIFTREDPLSCLGAKDINIPIENPQNWRVNSSLSDNFPSSFLVSGTKNGVVTRPIKWSKSDQQYVDEIIAWVAAGEVGQKPIEPRVICKWSGAGNTLRWSMEACKWQVNGFNKIGFQNTPVGSYAGGYTVS